MKAMAQSSDLFVPVHPNALRLPAVPLMTCDPYFCYWSRYDHLYDGYTTHWSGKKRPMCGVLRVDGSAYRFMGSSLEPLYPFASEKAWTGRYVTTTPTGTWTALNYDDSSWNSGAAAFGGGDSGYTSTCGTAWSGSGADIYVRRSMNLDEIDPNAEYYVMYKHDDVSEFYLNGTKIASHGETWDVSGTAVKVSNTLLRKGENVLAAHCHNTSGGAYVDMGLYSSKLQQAKQKSCTVMPNSTYYTIQCGEVDLDLIFTTPQLMDDLVLFSTPITYFSYQVKSNDGKDHDVQLMLEVSGENSVGVSGSDKTVNRKMGGTNLDYLRVGNATQNVMNGTGDLINWGYIYLSSDRKPGHKLALESHDVVLKEFLADGKIKTSVTSKTCNAGVYYSLAYTDSLGLVGNDYKSGFTMLGFDDTFSIQYHSTNRKGYWANNGRNTIQSRFEDLYANYDSIMNACRVWDDRIYNDGYEAGGVKYAEVLCASYRQTNAAHKLFTDTKGNLMYMSRENGSGGFINTLDVTYPSQPLYWIYSPALAKAMITPVFEYSALGKWNHDFPNHDLGAYPKANGNRYGNPSDGSGSTMPVEQSGNMLTLAAVIASMDGDMDYLRKYLPYMTKWANYLVENGKDPANQLCTDDFLGKSARNINLAAKAIMGVMSYAEICRMLGDEAGYEEYKAKAKDMATFWEKEGYTTSGSAHYLLNFGAAGTTWSTKYNLVWDKIWGWDLLKIARTRELNFYTTKMNTYGLPLDSRGSLAKTDWQMWAGGMVANKTAFTRYINPLWKYVNETTSRVPISDNMYTGTGKQNMFQARSVIGGHWMKVFMDKYTAGELTGIQGVPAAPKPIEPQFDSPWYDLSGTPVSQPRKHQLIIKNGKKVVM